MKNIRKTINTIFEPIATGLDKIAHRLRKIGYVDTIIQINGVCIPATTVKTLQEYCKQAKEEGFIIVSYNGKYILEEQIECTDEIVLDE